MEQVCALLFEEITTWTLLWPRGGLVESSETYPAKPTATLAESSNSEVIRSEVLSAARWRGLLQLSQQLLSVLATVVLARLLTPSDFGIAAFAMAVLTFASLASTWGFEAAIIRRSVIDDRLMGGILAANLAVTTTLSVGGVLAAPVVADLIGAPEARWALVALMPSVVLGGLASVSITLLNRRMHTGRIFLVDGVGMVVYIVLEIVLAAVGFGYWAVIIGYLAMQVLQCAGYIVAAGWRLRLAPPRSVVRSEGGFSVGYFTTGLATYANKNLDTWMVAATLGAAALGSYYIALVLPMILRARVADVVRYLLFPIFSRLRSDPERSRRAYASAIEFQAAVGIPAMLGVAIVAGPLVEVFFAEQWQASIDPMRLIALAAAVDLLGTGLAQAAIAHGRMARSVVVSAGRAVVLCAALTVVALGSGDLTDVALVVAVTSLIALVFEQVILGVPLGIHLGLVIGPVLRICALSGGMALATWGALRVAVHLGLAPAGQLAVAVVTGAAVYVVLGMTLAPRAYRGYLSDLLSILALRRTPAVEPPSGEG